MISRTLVRFSDNHEELSRQAAKRILAALRKKPDLLLCAAGGSTPQRTYELLVENYGRNRNAFHSLRVVKLDEWGGIPMDDPGSCESQFRAQLVEPLSLPAKRYFGFRSDPKNQESECAKIRQRLAKEGPIDLCVLGLGVNGHIGMNEPAPSLQPGAHVARPAKTSLRHSMLANSRRAPTYGLTLGMAEILASREILLLVSGASKRQPLRRLMKRELTTEFPASFLWLHPSWTLFCDREAARGLNLKP